MIVRYRITVEWRARCDVCVQLNVESQLVIVHLRWLQKTADLHGTLTLLLLSLVSRLLTLFSKEFGVVARELLKGNKEISQDDLESIEIRVRGEEPVNK